MTILFQDVRYALRMLRKSPVFALVVALSLGLGIGVNTTIFSFVNATRLRPPAVEKPGQLLRSGTMCGQEAGSIVIYP